VADDRDAGGLMPADSTRHQVSLGIAVRDRRRELGITQEELALRSGLHQRGISNVETGRRNPSYASLRRLAEALDLRASALLDRAKALETET
jgi:transcriptional regulator with XRE-family HTH domain